MRFYTHQHQYYCGVDLHARSLYVCILDQAGAVQVHQNLNASPEAFLQLVAPYRQDIAVAAECMFSWYWLADLCTREGIPFVLGLQADTESRKHQARWNESSVVHERCVWSADCTELLIVFVRWPVKSERCRYEYDQGEYKRPRDTFQYSAVSTSRPLNLNPAAFRSSDATLRS